MALHRLTTLTLGVPDPVSVGDYYEEFGLTALGDGRYGTVNGGEQLRLVPADRRRAVALGIGCDDPDDLDRVATNLGALGFESAREADAGRRRTTRAPACGCGWRSPRASWSSPRHGVTLNAPATCAGATCGRRRSCATSRRSSRASSATWCSPRSTRSARKAFFIDGVGFKVSDLTKDGAGVPALLDRPPQPRASARRRCSSCTTRRGSCPTSTRSARPPMAMIEKDDQRHVWGLGRHFLGLQLLLVPQGPGGQLLGVLLRHGLHRRRHRVGAGGVGGRRSPSTPGVRRRRSRCASPRTWPRS